MKTLHTLLPLLAVLFFGHVAFGQTLQRSVVATAAETQVSPDKSFSLTYVLGESFGDYLANPSANLYFTVGFIQPDNDRQIFLAQTGSQSIVVYPNPVSGNTVKLAFNKMPDGIYQIEIVDAIGRVLQTQTVAYRNNSFFYVPLDISQLRGGSYFIRVNNRLGFNSSIQLIKI
jgi:hypothetical protein